MSLNPCNSGCWLEFCSCYWSDLVSTSQDEGNRSPASWSVWESNWCKGKFRASISQSFYFISWLTGGGSDRWECLGCLATRVLDSDGGLTNLSYFSCFKSILL